MLEQKVAPKGKFRLEVIRAGATIESIEFDNGVVDEGLNSLLDVGFRGTSPITAWYIGLIDNASYSAIANADTAASHGGWIEFVGYSDSTRQAWSPGAASSRTLTNGTAATFNINATGVIKGGFIISNSTKSGTTGTLWCTGLFGSTISVSNGDQVKITYTVSG